MNDEYFISILQAYRYIPNMRVDAQKHAVFSSITGRNTLMAYGRRVIFCFIRMIKVTTFPGGTKLMNFSSD